MHPFSPTKITIVAMDEARDLDLSPSTSTVKPILAALGVMFGLMLLLCGGAAGYVALTSPPRSEEPVQTGAPMVRPEDSPEFQRMKKLRETREVPFTDDPDVVRKIAATIVDIDLPPDFEPIEANRGVAHRWVVFGKKSEPAALLKMAGMHRPNGDNSVPLVFDARAKVQILQSAENENGRNDTMLKNTRQRTQSVERELTIAGQKAVFEFKQGLRYSDKTPVRKIVGAFPTRTGGLAALIYMVPESEYDEEAVIRMLESMRPAPIEEEPGVNVPG